MRCVRQLLGAVAAVFFLAAASARAQQAVILVRHAEKADDQAEDPVLSAQGTARAAALARHLAAANVKAIYVTQYRRTGLTAAPLAAALKLTPITMNAQEAAATVANMRAEHAGDVVLYVGHSNTVGQIARASGNPGEFELDDDEYDNLFVLVPQAGQAPLLLRLKY
jgi:phosphohistidine phosphatase SixA